MDTGALFSCAIAAVSLIATAILCPGSDEIRSDEKNHGNRSIEQGSLQPDVPGPYDLSEPHNLPCQLLQPLTVGLRNEPISQLFGILVE
jgi:hypothetical protein